MENTLLRVAGALFCHDPKRRFDANRDNRTQQGRCRKAHRHPPGPGIRTAWATCTQSVRSRFIKKHSDYGRPIQKQVSFTKREIMRMIGRQEWGGRDSEELSTRTVWKSITRSSNDFTKKPGGKIRRALVQIFSGNSDRAPRIRQRPDRGLHHQRSPSDRQLA